MEGYISMNLSDVMLMLKGNANTDYQKKLTKAF